MRERRNGGGENWFTGDRRGSKIAGASQSGVDANRQPGTPLPRSLAPIPHTHQICRRSRSDSRATTVTTHAPQELHNSSWFAPLWAPRAQDRSPTPCVGLHLDCLRCKKIAANFRAFSRGRDVWEHDQSCSAHAYCSHRHDQSVGRECPGVIL